MLDWFTALVAHWPFFAAVLIFMVLGQVAKGIVGPSEQGWRKWFRKTMPLHPMLAGLGVGFIPGMPISFESTVLGVSLYYAAAGVLSTWAYSILKQLLKKRGITLESTPPPANAASKKP